MTKKRAPKGHNARRPSAPLAGWLLKPEAMVAVLQWMLVATNPANPRENRANVALDIVDVIHRHATAIFFRK